MRCSQSFVLFLAVIALTISITSRVNSKEGAEIYQVSTASSVLAQDCLPDTELSAYVRTLSSGRYADQQAAVDSLKTNATRSNKCREQVIKTLILVMDQPSLDLTGGTPQFYLWHYGTRLLGELKAVEALDLLIRNFDLHDGTAFPLNHHPALVGAIEMGEAALPKLEAVLKDDPDPLTRRYAVFCIAQIGGRSSYRILSKSLKRESDTCVLSCIRASLWAFNNKRRRNEIGDANRTQWYTTFLCKRE